MGRDGDLIRGDEGEIAHEGIAQRAHTEYWSCDAEMARSMSAVGVATCVFLGSRRAGGTTRQGTRGEATGHDTGMLRRGCAIRKYLGDILVL
jgi:hypothetical protein